MTPYLLDTNHASAVLKGKYPLIDRVNQRRTDATFGVPTPCVGELWYMVYNSEKILKNVRDLNVVLEDYVYWDFDKFAAEEFGRIKADLRRKGRPIPAVDIQIAAIARVNGLIVLTADAHFGYISDLRTENWLA